MRIARAPLPDGPMTAAPLSRWASGVASLDAALAGGLAYGRVHEVYAAEAEDAPAAAGFVAAVATGMADARRTIMWLRAARLAGRDMVLQANGWAEMGGVPDSMLLLHPPEEQALLWAAAEAARCTALGAVIVEGWGRMPLLDLTASRRLALAVEKSGVPLFLLRIDATPIPSAAFTRWQVASAPSRALPGNAPGNAAIALDLLRQKSGPCGLHWQLEWDRDQRQFRDAALSGAVVSVPFRGSAADAGARPLRQNARHAA